MTLKDQVIDLAALMASADIDDLDDLLIDLANNGTGHEGGRKVDSVALAIVEAAMDRR